ncbi:prepilin-type N-terminal cleavage/methylation domain-containing protein [Chloroflexota bacterium]
MRWLGKGKIRLFRKQTGFTLIEVVIAMGILGFIGAGFLTALNMSSKTTQSLDERVVAANLATAYLEAIKESPWALTYPNAGDNVTNPFQYDVVVDVAYSNDGGTTWVDTYTDETFQRITVNVSREGRYVLSVCTYRSKR